MFQRGHGDILDTVVFGGWKWIKLVQSLLALILCKAYSPASNKDGWGEFGRQQQNVHMEAK